MLSGGVVWALIGGVVNNSPDQARAGQSDCISIIQPVIIGTVWRLSSYIAH